MSFRHVRVYLLLIFAVTAIAVSAVIIAPQKAQADPHAVFYTATGQQQLFYNVLAALDQADFVETPEQRDALQQQLVAAQQAKSRDQLGATKTELANVLSRSVTLQGQDLWAAYQLRELALEVEKRRGTMEFQKVACEFIYGLVNCDTTQTANRQAQQDAFVVDPKTFVNNSVAAGNEVLVSGTQADQDLREKIATNKIPADYVPAVLPYNGPIAEATKNSPQVAARQAAAARNIGVSNPDPSAYSQMVENSATGAVTATTPATVKDVMDNIDRMMGQTVAWAGAKANAQAEALAAQKATTANGVNPDSEVIQTATIDGQRGSVTKGVKKPVQNRISLYNAAAQSLPDSTNSQVYSVPLAENTPGRQELIDRGSTTPANNNPTQPTTSLNTNLGSSQLAQGASTQGQNGQVAGILDWLNSIFTNYSVFYQSATPLNAEVNAIAPIEETLPGPGQEPFLKHFVPSFQVQSGASAGGLNVGQQSVRSMINDTSSNL